MADNDLDIERNISHKLPSASERKDYSYQHTKLTWAGRVEETFGAPLLEKLRGLIPEGKVLDIGSSTGDTTREMAKIFGNMVQVVGIELDADMFGEKGKNLQELFKSVGQVKERTDTQDGNQPHFAQANGYFPPFGKNSFNAVFMMNNLYQTVEHQRISADQLKVVMGNISHIIKPNGFLCVSGLFGAAHPFIIYRFDEKKNVSIFAESKIDSKSDRNLSDNFDDIFHTISDSLDVKQLET